MKNESINILIRITGILFSIAFSLVTVMLAVRLGIFMTERHMVEKFPGEICSTTYTPWSYVMGIAGYVSTIVVVYALVRSFLQSDDFSYVYIAIHSAFCFLFLLFFMVMVK